MNTETNHKSSVKINLRNSTVKNWTNSGGSWRLESVIKNSILTNSQLGMRMESVIDTCNQDFYLKPNKWLVENAY